MVDETEALKLDDGVALIFSVRPFLMRAILKFVLCMILSQPASQSALCCSVWGKIKEALKIPQPFLSFLFFFFFCSVNMSNQQLNISASQPLRLRNPTPYHLMATNNSGYSSTPHPLADIEVQQSPFQQQYNRESPTDQQQNHIEFNDSFSQNLMHGMSSPLANEFEDHHSHNPMYDNRGSFSSTNMVCVL
jgi:hypothetical protein